MSSTDKNHVKNSSADKAGIGRRKLLKGTSAIPVVLTLHSGASMAVTSNLVGKTGFRDAAMNGDGDRFCVDYESPVGEKYDLGTSPHATLIDGSKPNKTQRELCNKKGGIWMSAIAFNSIANRPGGISITS